MGLAGLGAYFAFVLAIPFLVIGLLWLMVRRLKRLEAHIRALEKKEELPPEDASDRALVRNLVLAYVAVVLLVVGLVSANSLILPKANPVTNLEYGPVPADSP
ncbi:MAG TPA: hypothetical protein VND22_04030 [Actinomycetota bacterium]|nr:hypothetical protein [Actinomycetota bacterium]